MKLRSILFGLAQSTFPDLSIGLLVAHIATKLVDHKIFVAYLVGIFFALLPDVDAAFQAYFSRRVDTHHRSLTHLPLVVVGISICFIPFSPLFGSIAATCLLFHFVHDSIGDEESGGGLLWLWPLSKSHYGFFQTKDGKRRFVVSWTPEEMAYRPPLKMKIWLERCYLRVCPHSIFAWVSIVFTISVIAWTL